MSCKICEVILFQFNLNCIKFWVLHFKKDAGFLDLVQKTKTGVLRDVEATASEERLNELGAA